MNRTLVGLAAALLLLAVVTLLIGFGQSLASVQLQHAPLPGTAEFQVDAPDTWLLWQSQPTAIAAVDGGRPEHLPSALGPVGEVLEPLPTVRTIRFTKGDVVHIVVGRYDVPASGSWRLDGPGGQWAVGPDPMGRVMLWSIGTTALAIVLLGGALCTGWIGLRRPRRHGSAVSRVC